jgi:uncharacterized glyoxalase superfamily protein PhnB
MSDPFDVLHEPLTPADPDPTFAAALRSRVKRALALPRGVQMTSTAPARVPSVMAGGRASLTPYLAVDDARRAIAWYVEVLDARPVGDAYVQPDGRIGHAELEIGGTRLYLSDAHPDIGVVAPGPTGNDVTLHLDVVAVDVLAEEAVAAGATLDRPPSDNPYGRIAVIRDPFGHRWMLDQPIGAEPTRHGDVVSWALRVPDAERAREFYAGVLDWTYDGDEITGGSLPGRIVGGYDDAGTVLGLGVSDVRVALDAAREAGAVVGAVVDTAGLAAIEHDGLAFVLQPLPRSPRAAVNGAAPGDISYLTVQVHDTGRTRQLLSTVAGWTFSPGRVEDGWQATEPTPMTGLSGGHDRASVVPMYRVADVDASVATVRALGGTATDAETQPYGRTSLCADDQGARFYLGQMS